MILNNIIDKTATNNLLNMKPTTTKKPSISFIPPEPVPRILITQTDMKQFKIWKGCIYISSYDHTGQVLMLLRDIKWNANRLFLKNQMFVFVSKDKSKVESQISEKMQAILKNK
jgi:hypothetical protein